MKLRSVAPMKAAKYGYIGISIIFCLGGIALFLLPMPPAHVTSILLGIALIVFGIIKLIGYYSKDLFRLAFQFDLQFGILMIILGIITLFKRAEGMYFICTAYGICLIIDSLFRIRIALDAKRFGIQTWWIIPMLAVFSCIIGLLLTICPYAALSFIKTLLGISLLAEGILSLSVVISMVKIVKHQQPDVIDSDDYEIWEGK